jgi:hypothetical protein
MKSLEYFGYFSFDLYTIRYRIYSEILSPVIFCAMSHVLLLGCPCFQHLFSDLGEILCNRPAHNCIVHCADSLNFSCVRECSCSCACTVKRVTFEK